MKYGEKWKTYASQWDAMKVNSGRENEFVGLAKRLLANKKRYVAIEDVTGVPWYLIAVLHLRESNANFNTYLGNGQPLNRKTTIVPKGRGPFKTFEEGAADALHIDGLDQVTDWKIEKVLWHAEKYNGLGYEKRSLPSPYLWGGTNEQRAGKFVADGKFDKNVMDRQPGCAPIIRALAHLDDTIHFDRETAQ